MKNIVSKEIFAEIISQLRTVDAYHKGLNEFFEKSGVHGFLYSPDATAEVVELLKIMFKDKAEVIGAYCFDMDYGRGYKAGFLKDEGGNDIDISTPENLYDYLVGDY